MDGMEDYYIFDEFELLKIGVTCRECGTEVLFDMTKEQKALDADCPGCHKELLFKFSRRAASEYTAISEYKALRDMPKSNAMRLYFKKNPSHS